jgi:hypothetical protein
MRQEEALDALKKRIAESARKAGMGGEFEGLEKNLKVCSFCFAPQVVFKVNLTA